MEPTSESVSEWLRLAVEDAHSRYGPRHVREHEVAEKLLEALGHLGVFVRGGGGRLYFMKHTGRSIRVSLQMRSAFVVFVLGLLVLSPVRWVTRAITLAVARAEQETPWEQEKGSR